MRVATLESPDLECPMTTPLFFTVGQSQPSVPHSLVRNNNPSKSWAPHSGASLLVKCSRVGQTTMASIERHPPSSGDPLSPTSVTHQRAKLMDGSILGPNCCILNGACLQMFLPLCRRWVSGLLTVSLVHENLMKKGMEWSELERKK